VREVKIPSNEDSHFYYKIHFYKVKSEEKMSKIIFKNIQFTGKGEDSSTLLVGTSSSKK